MKYRKNDVLKLEIISLGSDGEGIAKADGFPIFIKDSVPGDICEIKLTKVKKNLAYGRLLRMIEPSCDRVDAPCPVSRQCGGCTLQAVSYDRQLEYKRDRVKECLVRIGGMDREIIDRVTGDTVGMKEPFRYRNKAQYPIGYDSQGNLTAGFFAGRSHRIIPNDDCVLLPEEFAGILKALLDYMKTEGVAAYDEGSRTGDIRHLVLKKAFATGQIMAVIVSTGDSLPCEETLCDTLGRAGNVKTVVLNTNRENTNVILGPKNRILCGSGYITDILCGLKFQISPFSFYQINPHIAESLYRAALELAGLSGRENVWDVCCGIGTITLFFAGHCKRITGIEIIKEATDDARENAILNGIENAEFITGAAEEVLPEMAAEEKPDVVILDPPRSGMERAALDAVIKAGPEKIVYVSCDPATLARDVRILCDAGYILKNVRPFDQFCHSAHVESCVLLRRVSNRKADSYVKLNVKMEDYYRIKDAEGGEMNG